MFKNFFRKVRATLKNSDEAIGIAAAFMGVPPVWLAATNAATAQYQDDPLAAFAKNTALTSAVNQFNPIDGGVLGHGSQTLNPYSSKVPAETIISNNSNNFSNLPFSAPGSDGTIPTDTTSSNYLTSLFDKNNMSGTGAMISSLGPGLATYFALMGEDNQQPGDPKEYRSAVDDYYAAKARGENPNPADFGLAPTPAEDMVKDLRFDIASNEYKDVPAARSNWTAASGGVAQLYNGGNPEVEVEETETLTDSQSGLQEMFALREKINAPRVAALNKEGIAGYDVMDEMSEEVVTANTGGVIGLALGGGKFPRKTGQIRGPGGPKDDKIPAMLSNGEFVMTAKAVQNAGGPKAMYKAMNKLDPASSRAPQSV
tara:strand:- start:483 stop:1595 length:1113 start_codon:yes stop_codon:yes gene_type:complete